MVFLPSGQLPLNVLQDRQACIQLSDSCLKLNGYLLEAGQGCLQFHLLSLVVLALLLIQSGQSADLSVLCNPHLLHVSSQLVKVTLVELVDTVDLSLPSSILLFLLVLEAAHLVEMVTFLSSKPIMEVFKLCIESIFLVLELLPVPLLLSCELIAVELIEASVFIGTHTHLLVLALLVVGELPIPLVLALNSTVTQVSDLGVLAVDLGVVTRVLSVEFPQMSLLLGSSFPLLLLQSRIQLFDLGLQLVLELLVHLIVLFDLLCDSLDLVLQLLTCLLTVLEVS